MSDTETTELAPFIPLEVEGGTYKLITPPEQVKRRDEVVATAVAITIVKTADEATLASQAMKACARIRTDTEKSRVILKKPFLDGGAEVDAFCKRFAETAITHEKRLEGIILTFTKAEREKQLAAERKAQAAREQAEREAKAAEQARIAAEAAIEREKEAERQKAEEAAKTAPMSLDDLLGTPGPVVPPPPTAADLHAEELRKQEEAAKAKVEEAQSQEFAAITAGPAVKGLGQEIAFEVAGATEEEKAANLRKFADKYPQLVKIEIRVADTTKAIKDYHARAGKLPDLVGLRIFHKDKLSKR